MPLAKFHQMLHEERRDIKIIALDTESDKWCFTTSTAQPVDKFYPDYSYSFFHNWGKTILQVLDIWGREHLVANPDPRYEPDFAYEVYEMLGMI